MDGGDGLPLTAFQPLSARRPGSPVARYLDVATFETMQEFTAYAAALHEAGFFVPRNWTLGDVDPRHAQEPHRLALIARVRRRTHTATAWTRERVVR